MELLAVLDGTVMPAAEARVPASDHGLLRGDGIFEVIRLYAGRPYGLDLHLERLTRSAQNLRLELSPATAREEIEALAAAAGEVEAAVRYVVTRSGTRLGLVEPLGDLPETLHLISVAYAPTRVLDGVKSLSYAANMLTRRLAQEQGADDALLHTPHGRVLEGPTSAFFAVLDGALVTPPLSDHILDSITRRIVLSEAGAHEQVITRDDLAQVTEAFLASTLREVHPIRRIDDRDLPAVPGPLTLVARGAVSARIAADLASAAA